MAGIYFTDMADVLRSAGCQVAENDITAGWQTRSRKSGGFPAAPLGTWMHHTASQTSVNNDLTWMIRTSPERPIGNVLLDRAGVWWPIAAGASNCAGRGGPWQFSRGVCGRDVGNTHGFQIEAANGGTGEPWPVAQINSYLQGVLALNRRFGNAPTDVVTHHAYAPTRKIDPARADAVQGSWQPTSHTRAGTWHLDSIHARLDARAGAPAPTPPPMPGPTPEGDDEVLTGFWQFANTPSVFTLYTNGTKIWQIDPGMLKCSQDLATINGINSKINVQTSRDMFRAFGPVVGPRPPGTDEWGVPA